MIKMIQITTLFVMNQGNANEILRAFQQQYTKRKIIGVSMVPTEPGGWFMTITYEVNL